MAQLPFVLLALAVVSLHTHNRVVVLIAALHTDRLFARKAILASSNTVYRLIHTGLKYRSGNTHASRPTTNHSADVPKNAVSV